MKDWEAEITIQHELNKIDIGRPENLKYFRKSDTCPAPIDILNPLAFSTNKSGSITRQADVQNKYVSSLSLFLFSK